MFANSGKGSGRRGKVLVAMSGGVDSSVAAALLKADGYEVVGGFMRLGSDPAVSTCPTAGESAAPSSRRRGCCSVTDAEDARHVAARLDVPLYVMNFRRDFGRVIDYFVDEYHAGRTPNPCVRCNDWLKFGKLHDYARSIDCAFVASGHHARVDRAPGGARLLRGKDRRKDQSYVLFGTPRQRLEQLLLPIGDLTKVEVRRVAAEFDLPVFDKPDSQEICFVPDNDYARLLRQRDPERLREGDILDGEGRIVGRHPGHQHFTIGQRRGVGLALGHPVYVTGIDAAANTVTVGGKDALRAAGCRADRTNWLIDDIPWSWRRCQVKVRYNCDPVAARVRAVDGGGLEVRFAQPLSAVTPGQAVVCYQQEQVMGGGWITETTVRP